MSQQQRPRQAKSRQNQKARQNQKPNAQPTNPQVVTKDEPPTVEELEEITCLTCVEPITAYSVADGCTHKDLCGKCTLRLRLLYKKTTCVLCKVSIFFSVKFDQNFKSKKQTNQGRAKVCFIHPQSTNFI